MDIKSKNCILDVLVNTAIGQCVLFYVLSLFGSCLVVNH